MSQTLVSCPGKVLITGGYLVLDSGYTGIVLGTGSRFYTIVQSADSIPKTCSEIIIKVKSPQFLSANWNYSFKLSNQNQIDLIMKPLDDQIESSLNQNKFVELALCESIKLSMALQKNHRCLFDQVTLNQSNQPQQTPYTLSVTILADNDFYSQPRHEKFKLPPFNQLHTTLNNVHKTGLGSSAAMVTSLCSAILLHLTPNLNRNEKNTKQLLHNLAQYVHSMAQGKVGSGFDVSAAIWGTHLYRRFSPSCFDILLNANEAQISSEKLRLVLDPMINPTWSDAPTAPKVESFKIPKYTTLLLADVDAGSHTPSMVKKVLEWKNNQPESASRLWDKISKNNHQLRLTFEKLSDLEKQDEVGYLAQLTQLSQDSSPLVQQNDTSCPKAEDNAISLFFKASSFMKLNRKLMKRMGNKANVPIEPDSQTRLLDECQKLNGVIGCGVPGAGGYDAIWVLAFSTPDYQAEIFQGLLKLWESWPEVSVKGLSPDSWVIGGLDTKQGDGLRVLDSIDSVHGLREILEHA
ncbi:hypothetical protein O181_023906 [Austropuccinia psidii MF-1]|uniref:Phosphomevalonate kinase n=1 Tax=Austropuccinia psidii MF-1 TaxID=1389203 RepID=A0A9Q3CKB2_9BASI|nr:hypothetical protein [Austropuccinia psidii MF-1]